MKLNVHAGHNPAGKIACGATGILDESKENRRVKGYLIDFLRTQGHTVYDCTCNNGTSQNDVLKKIVDKCNAHSGISCDISLHLNAGGGHGSECEIYGTGGNAEKYAKKIQSAIVKRTGYTNRGVKVRKDLYVLRKTNAPAVLVECCFVDSAADAKRWNPQTMAAAICEGLTGVNPLENKPSTQTKSEAPTKPKEEKIVYKTINDVPEWCKPTIEKLIADGALVGTGNDELNISDDACRVLVLLDRLGKL
ncbi:MAG: N-acetylmuramoyl-L-alanine amidase [Eubacteriales bacterium]|nr:N-acetylmuramoyl-L-alanine amidase [Eubacteriales bacterium]